jgi:hypothetical protein
MFYEGYSITNNNLYNLYWRRTVNQINVGKMLTAYFNLKEDDIHGLKLNSKIRIDNSWWTINKVIDYDCNANNLTKVELMSADTEIDLAPFKKQIVIPTTTGDTASHTGSIHWDNSFVGNVVAGTSVANVYGRGNVIQPNVNGIVVGNNRMLDQTGISTERITADVANFTTLNVLGGTKYPVSFTTSDYYLTDNDYFLLCTDLNLNVYLPLSTPENIGRVYVISVGDPITVTVSVNGGGDINASPTVTLNQFDVLRVIYIGGTIWWEI